MLLYALDLCYLNIKNYNQDKILLKSMLHLKGCYYVFWDPLQLAAQGSCLICLPLCDGSASTAI